MNFALILFVLLVVTGVLYAVDVGFFPVILIVFVLRSFLFEPF